MKKPVWCVSRCRCRCRCRACCWRRRPMCPSISTCRAFPLHLGIRTAAATTGMATTGAHRSGWHAHQAERSGECNARSVRDGGRWESRRRVA